jgi:hypothetical protein
MHQHAIFASASRAAHTALGHALSIATLELPLPAAQAQHMHQHYLWRLLTRQPSTALAMHSIATLRLPYPAAQLTARLATPALWTCRRGSLHCTESPTHRVPWLAAQLTRTEEHQASLNAGLERCLTSKANSQPKCGWGA